MKRSIGQWAPWMSDPDDPEEAIIMTPEESRRAAEKVAEMYPELLKKNAPQQKRPIKRQQGKS